MKIIIDGKECDAKYGEYILEIAKRNDIYIPTLCHSEALPGLGTCRLCIVEILEKGRSKIVSSCLFPVTSEIEVLTRSEKIIKMRKTIVMLLAARAPENEVINKLRIEYGVPLITRLEQNSKENCILCGLCVKACEAVGNSAICTTERGISKRVSTPYDEESELCIGCGACAFVCPTKGIKLDETKEEKTMAMGNEIINAKCENCGSYFAPLKQFEFAQKKSQIKHEKVLCVKCRKKLQSEKFKTIYENVES
jgi:bidirectional [NiFe] hydrogenase diaphorase subunit